MLLLDTSAWIEFFNGSKKGQRVKEMLRSNVCYTSIVTVAEVTNWALKEGRNINYLLNTIEQLSSVIKLDKEISSLAGRFVYEGKRAGKTLGVLNPFILATGTIYGLKILTNSVKRGAGGKKAESTAPATGITIGL
ncbi:MAG: PIN domain-containing protein [Candidatus Micrarchaeota archaeon]|nr:PIN domain-containing protein [Candidatus Micrarchaeota archaeon]